MTFVTRAAVVTQARTWIDTPFHHQASIKGVGADCVGPLRGVAIDLGLVAAGFDVPSYPRVPDGRLLMSLANLHMTPVEPPLLPGHVVVVTMGDHPQHLGIVGDYRHGGLSIIHALMRAGRVVETRLMYTPMMRFVAAFDLPGVADG